MRVIDNQVDQTTGTVKLKAEFPNANVQLWPGQFVNVRLLIDTLKDVVTVPTAAVQRGPDGTFVYVVKDDSTASMRPIVVQKQDETQTVVTSGVAARRTRGHHRLRAAHRRQQGHHRQRQTARRRARPQGTTGSAAASAPAAGGRTHAQ